MTAHKTGAQAGASIERNGAAEPPGAERSAHPEPPASAQAAASNPFSHPSPLPFHAPQFNLIKDSDFEPAIDEGMRQQIAEIETIASHSGPPTFENTIMAMEKTGQMLHRVKQVFQALNNANTNDVLQKIDQTEAPRLAAHQDAIYLNAKLFHRVEAIYHERETLHLSPEAMMLVKVYHHDFIHAGAKLPDARKTRLRTINQQLASLMSEFNIKLLAGTKAAALVVSAKSQLAGLSEDAIDAAAQAAEARGLKGRWVLPLQNTTQQPSLAFLKNRAVRKELFEKSWTRTEQGDANDTREIVATIAKLRAEKAALLGYPNYAAYVLDNQMAKNPATVESFLNKLVPPATAKARAEANVLRSLIHKDGETFELRSWDWKFCAEQERQAEFDLDDSEILPYFELNHVLENGVLYAAHKLYGITFKERSDLPIYQADLRVFELFDRDASALGLIYFDLFRRDNKSGGAWMDYFVGQSKLLGTKPVVYNVTNFAKPAPGQPTLLSFDEVTWLFHEFGHALHELFADQEFPTLSGVNVASDFVEFPSRFNEHWALDPSVLKHYAIHYKTGKPMPQKLVEKLQRSRKFHQGYALAEVLAAVQLDMQWHTLSAAAPKESVDKFEVEALQNTHLDLPEVPPRYRSTYFQHIWTNGYAAGYYAYLWAEMLDNDAYQWFLDHGGMTRANGQRFRDTVLSRGHSEDYSTMFRNFYGKNPDIGPMLKNRGIHEHGHC